MSIHAPACALSRAKLRQSHALEDLPHVMLRRPILMSCRLTYDI